MTRLFYFVYSYPFQEGKEGKVKPCERKLFWGKALRCRRKQKEDSELGERQLVLSEITESVNGTSSAFHFIEHFYLLPCSPF